MNTLTHWGWVTHICVSKLTIIGSENGLSAPSHYLNQSWNIVNSNLGKKFQWNIKQNSYIFIQWNAFKNVCETAAILSRPQCVKRKRAQVQHGKTQCISHQKVQHWWLVHSNQYRNAGTKTGLNQLPKILIEYSFRQFFLIVSYKPSVNFKILKSKWSISLKHISHIQWSANE